MLVRPNHEVKCFSCSRVLNVTSSPVQSRNLIQAGTILQISATNLEASRNSSPKASYEATPGSISSTSWQSH